MSPSIPADVIARCTILAGPNGSGKSSIYETLRPPGEFVNADEVARRIHPDRPETVAIAAGREVLARLRVLVEGRQDFVYETTLSSRQSLTLMRDARAVGYLVHLIFVTLADATLNVQRVADRVRRGGHSIPETTIRRRHQSAFKRLIEAIPIARVCSIYDNTGLTSRLLLRLEDSLIKEAYLDPRSPQHFVIAQSVAKAIGCEERDVWAVAER